MLLVLLVLLLVFVFLAMIFAFRQIMTKNVISATTHLEEISQDYDKKEKELNQRLKEVEQKSQEFIAKSQQEAEDLKTQTIKQAEAERDRILKQARQQNDEIIQQAEKSRQQLLLEIEERIAKEAVNKACELIQDALPEEFKQDMHKRWVEDLLENGFSGLERLRIPKDIQEIKVISAFALSEGQRKTLTKKLKDVLGYEVALKEETDPKIVVGLVAMLGSLVLDGSLKNKIQERSKNA